MVLLTVSTCVTVTAMAIAMIVVSALKFAQWAIERDDRLYAQHEPITSAIWKMKQDTLLSQRKQHEERYALLTKSGFDSLAHNHEVEIQRVDGEILKLARTEIVD